MVHPRGHTSISFTMCTLRLSDRRDYCFTCSQGQKLLSVAVWDVKTGIVCRVYSCDTGVTTGAGSTGVGGASAVCLLGETHLLCAPKVVPFIYVWNLKKVSKEKLIAKFVIFKMTDSATFVPFTKLWLDNGCPHPVTFNPFTDHFKLYGNNSV